MSIAQGVWGGPLSPDTTRATVTFSNDPTGILWVTFYMTQFASRGRVRGLRYTPGVLRLGTAAAIFFVVSAPGYGAAEYVGSKVCAGCHPQVYAQYHKTPMGRSMEPADDTDLLATAAPPVTIHSDRLDRYFEVFSKDSALYETEYAVANGQRVFEDTYKLDYIVGSGQNGRTPIVRRGDFLVEAPLTYYSKSHKWDLS
ncbi:MAG: hypothetical protein ACRD2O_12180, partial [Terriglobia bacterium]